MRVCGKRQGHPAVFLSIRSCARNLARVRMRTSAFAEATPDSPQRPMQHRMEAQQRKQNQRGHDEERPEKFVQLRGGLGRMKKEIDEIRQIG